MALDSVSYTLICEADFVPCRGIGDFEYENCALNSVAVNSPFVSRFGVPGTSITVNATRLDDF